MGFVKPSEEIEIVRMLGAVYTISDISMLKAKFVAEVDPVSFLPYSFMKGDR